MQTTAVKVRTHKVNGGKSSLKMRCITITVVSTVILCSAVVSSLIELRVLKPLIGRKEGRNNRPFHCSTSGREMVKC